MASHDTARPDATTSAAVLAWHRERLVMAGFDRERARRLAEDPRHDLRALLALVERGCPPHLAERILAPLDD